MADKPFVLWPRKSIRAFYGPAATLAVVAECPAPGIGVGVTIAKRHPDPKAHGAVTLPEFEIVSYPLVPTFVANALGGGGEVPSPYLIGGGGEIPVPFNTPGGGGDIPAPFGRPTTGTISVFGVFHVLPCPEKVRVYFAEGSAERSDDVAVERVHEALGAVGVGEESSNKLPGVAEATGYSDVSFEEAFSRAANQALAELGSSGTADGMAVARVVDSGALYGGIAGWNHKLFVRVRATTDGVSRKTKSQAMKEDVGQRLELSLSVQPEELYIDDMPPVSDRPQPGTVVAKLSIKNPSRSDYRGFYKNSGFVHFSALDGRRTIWMWPHRVAQHVTEVRIDAGKTLSITSHPWHIADIRQLRKNQGISIVGQFMPTGQSVHIGLPVKEVV
jgi:hypothetical protein